ncbi:MAG TPA: PAS domain-containing sensor histidine kinase [Bacteroidales bacterium]|nr:PAS domain-containing sensor histidine kinase [Bacteroidales bacterium]
MNTDIKILLHENEILRMQLAEAEETLNAIRNGEVDAIVVSGKGSEKIFTLTSAETPYRHLIEEMDEGAVTISDDGVILYCNRRFAQLVSIPMEQIVGSNFSRFFNNEHIYNYRNLLMQTIRGKFKEETVQYCVNNECRFFHFSFCAMPEGALGKVCIIVSDITELKKYQEELQLLVNERTAELQTTNRELEESNAIKDKLFSIIAHDLKSPFTTLLGFSELLVTNFKEYDMEQFQMMLSHIQSAAKSAFTLLENLLLWAMAQNEQLQFSPELVNVTQLARDVTRNLKPMAAMKDIWINCLPDQPIEGFVDVNMFRTIIRNLVSNAIKFSYNGGSIDVNISSNDSELIIIVSDNGIGMTEDIKNKLFMLERNKSATGTAQEKGTGLGLLICHDFVQKHGGSIQIESELEKGSSFIVKLPQHEFAYVSNPSTNQRNFGQE